MCNNADIAYMIEAERNFVKDLSEAQRFRYFLGRMQYVEYESGSEDFLSADCSGSVCFALLLATGCAVRVTADELYRKFFTKKRFSDDDIQAVFFIADGPKKIGYRVYHDKECAHVAGVCGKDVVLNCVYPNAILRSISDMIPFYNKIGYKIVIRGLDRRALHRASRLGTDLYGADSEFLQFRDTAMSKRFRENME